MSKNMYRRLALQNIRNNRNTFFPFTLSVVVMCAMFYMLSSIHKQAGENLFFGASTMQIVLGMGANICGFFSLFVIFYTNSFLIKKRAMELGMYSILGMEKKHINKVVFWEMYIIGIISICLGLVFGILISKLMFLVLVRIIGLKGEFAFSINPDSVVSTVLLFVAVFAVVIAGNMLRIYCLKPIQLMNSSRVGEREPKAKWALAIVGVLCLSGGYFLAVAAKNPLEALGNFFIAVMLVIAGTYLLFISGSIVLLKLLKKNRNFYYKKNHFIAISGMMYRMKQNAVGLANICILSTAVLVVVSTTVSLYLGIDNLLHTRFPHDVMTDYVYSSNTGETEEQEEPDYSLLLPAAQKLAEKYQVAISDVQSYYSYDTMVVQQKNHFSLGSSRMDTVLLEAIVMDPLQEELSDIWEADAGEGISVLYDTSGGVHLEGDTLRLGEGLDIRLAGTVDAMDTDPFNRVLGRLYLVVHDLEDLEKIRDALGDGAEDGIYGSIHYNFNFNLKGKESEEEDFCKRIKKCLEATGVARLNNVEYIYSKHQDFMGVYGGLFFIGCFIGMLFLLTTAMIIYYKQISEGYDDRDRFAILRKVGMSGDEIKRTVTSQILLVFFLPILLAVIHICVAFDIIRKILLMLNLSDWVLFVKCTVGTVAVFFLVYAIIFRLTARVYYKIVKE